MSLPYKIILVDDHEMVRTAFKELIENAGPYKVEYEFSSGKEFLNAYPLEADLLILDLSMPQVNGSQVVKRLKELNTEIKILIVTMESSDDWVVQLFKDGIRGYLKKQSPSSELKKAIEDIINFGYYHNDILNQMIHGSGKNTKNHAKSLLERITDKELEFLRLVCHDEEYTYEQMAGIMNVHRRTLDNYRESLFEKFSIKSKSGLVMFAMKHKLFDMENDVMNA